MFSNTFIKFFKDLEANNNKEWFDANKSLYINEIKAPFLELVDEIISELNKELPHFDTNAKQSMFRIYRDVRFSKDKTPYKTHASASMCHEGKKSGHTAYYLMMNHRYLMIGGGKYDLDKENLRKIREEISYNLDEFHDIINRKEFLDLFGSIKGEKNKIIPKEFKEDVEKQPYIANKQFYFMAELSPQHILKNNLKQTILKHYKAGFELNSFLERAMFE